ncbi:MAG: 50S ribosomal protein P1, partial [Candidatus Pacearchaeota archaeon]|nr:50S ribosomal protein P1 [Candidatus Pacearchaeota archaeon]
ADDSKIKSLVASLKGVDIASELANASLIAATPAGGSAPAEAKEEAPKEEKHEAAAEGLSALFG